MRSIGFVHAIGQGCQASIVREETKMADDLFDLTGKVAVVTGSGAHGGLGHAMALGLARYGADVLPNDIDEEGAKITSREIEALGRKSAPVRCDTSNPDHVAFLFAEVDRVFGKIDILINNAGICIHTAPEELSLEEWNKHLSINATGYFLCSQQAIQRMLRQGTGGSIINISSIAGQTGLGRGNLAYSSSKGAVDQLTKELAVEFAGQRIRVNALLPANVKSPTFMSRPHDHPGFDVGTLGKRFLEGMPMNRLLELDEMVGPAVFLASEASSAITGVLLPVDGGNLAFNACGSLRPSMQG